MSALKTVAKVLIPAYGAASLLKAPKAPQVQMAPARDDVEERDSVLQRLRRRKGAGANELLGPGGAEAAIGSSQMGGN